MRTHSQQAAIDIGQYVLEEITAQQLSATEEAMEECAKAFHAMYEKCTAQGLNAHERRAKSVTAFKLRIPPMDCKEHIQQAIACVVAGMNAEVFSAQEANRLLYAAQVAISVCKMEDHRP